MKNIDYSEYTHKDINTNELVLAIMKGLGFKKSKTLYTYFYNEEVIGTSHYKKMLEKHKNGEKLADNDTIKILKALLGMALGVPYIDSISFNYVENIIFALGLSQDEAYKYYNRFISDKDLSSFVEYAKWPSLMLSSELTKHHYSILSELNHYFLKKIPTDDLFGMSMLGSFISGVQIKQYHYDEMARDFCGCMYMFYTKLLDLCLDEETINPTIKLKKAAKIFLEDLLLQNYYDRIYIPLTKSAPIPNKPCSLPRNLPKKRLDKSNVAPYDYNERSHKDITGSESYIIPLYQELTEASCKFVESQELYKSTTDKHEESVLAKSLSENKKQLDSIIAEAVDKAFKQDQMRLSPNIVRYIALSAAYLDYNHMVYQNSGKDYLAMYYPVQIVDGYKFRFTYIETLKDFARYYNEMLGETAYVYNMYKAKVDEYKKLEHENEVLKEKLAQFESNNT